MEVVRIRPWPPVDSQISSVCTSAYIVHMDRVANAPTSTQHKEVSRTQQSGTPGVFVWLPAIPPLSLLPSSYPNPLLWAACQSLEGGHWAGGVGDLRLHPFAPCAFSALAETPPTPCGLGCEPKGWKQMPHTLETGATLWTVLFAHYYCPLPHL